MVKDHRTKLSIGDVDRVLTATSGSDDARALVYKHTAGDGKEDPPD